MLDQERDLESDEQQPEVDFAQTLVQHLAGHLGPPEVQAREHEEDHGPENDVVEVRDDEVAVGHVEVQRWCRQDDSGQASEQESDHETHRPQHGRVEGNGAPPHGADPVEELHARWDGDQHRHQCEERQIHRTSDIHVVRPHREAEGSDRHGGEDQALVAENGFTRENRDDLAGDAEERQRDDVHLGVTKEPEQVLPQDGSAVFGQEDDRAEGSVDEHHQKSSGKNRKSHQNEHRGDEDRPREDGHPEHGHARCAHRHDRRDEVHPTEDGAETTDRQTDEPQVCAGARGEDSIAQRRVREPAEGGGPAGGQEAGSDDEAAEEEQPEPEHVQPGEGDVRGADLQRHDHVAESDEQRRCEQQQHDCAVHGE